MKLTKHIKVEQFEVNDMNDTNSDSFKLRKLLANLSKEDLIDVKTEQKSYNYIKNIITVIYLSEESTQMNNP